jgi:threonine dehydratase
MRDLRDYTQLLRVLDSGDMMTHQEMAQVADIIRALKVDADRYRWLNQATHQLFMVSERDLNEQVDRAMNGGRE